MSLKRASRFFYKAPYKYVTQSDVKFLTVKQIANINPDEVDAKLKWLDGGVEITEAQKRAVLFLCQLKKTVRATPQTDRPALIRQFIANEFRRQVTANAIGPLIAQTKAEVDLDNAEKLRNQIPNAPSTAIMPWPTVPTDHVHVGGRRAKSRRAKSRRAKSRRTKSRRTKSRRTKSRRK